MPESAVRSEHQPSEHQPVATPVTPHDVLLLQAVRAYPSVSVLMTTTPAPVMGVTDHTRLQDLVDQAVLKLRRAQPAVDLRRRIEALHRLADGVATEPTDAALGLFVGARTESAYRLGVPVTDRVVVDSSFATRDLVLALQRTPRHLVLILSSREARLFESVNGHLQPAAGHGFPYRSERPRRQPASRPRVPEADTASFLRDVDKRLGTYRAVHPSPLVLVGPTAVLHAFTATARHAYRLAGTLSGNHVDATLEELTVLLQPVLQRYLASREAEALDVLASRSVSGKVVAGLPRSWLAARTEQPEMLAVEQGLFYPARISPDGLTVTLDHRLDEPDVVDDAVDELIEHVLIRGGWVAMVSDGGLERYEGVALVVR